VKTPTVSYLVCGTNRSGTNLLCGLLKGTGVAGRPEEYFCRGHEQGWAERWGASEPTEYVRAAIEAGTTPNGVFGAKLVWPQLADLLAKLRVVHGDRWPSERELLERALPDLRFVWIQREDVVAQAVSFSRAIQTNEWTAGDRRHPSVEPRFDFVHVYRLLGEVRRQNRAWQTWFAANRVRPLQLRYADLVEDMEGVTSRLLASLGIDLPHGTVVEPQHSKQADERSIRRRHRSAGTAASAAAWAATRYRAMRELQR
jgi:LPS sulfotransferase NodH